MASGLYFPISALAFSLLTIITFFVKGPVKTIETKIYKYLIISNLVGLIIEILCTYASYISGTNPVLSDFILKLYLVYNLVWTTLLTTYVFYVSVPKNIVLKYKTLYKCITTILLIISTIIIYILKCELIIQDNFRVRYTQGPSVNFTYTACGFLIFLIVLLVLIDYKSLKNKKYIPIYVFIIAIISGIVIQKSYPGLLIMTYVETLTIAIMFHTIENPDTKLINQLELAKNQAEKANRAKTDFLSSMSHEIRTPLNAIVGLSNVIKESDDLNEIHEDASDVVSASNTLLEIVNGILDISRIEADKMEIVEVSYNPLEEFKSLVTLAETRIGEKEIELRSDFAIDLPETLYGDKGKVKQIITNLLSNAVKYTEKGYIDFKVTCINEKDISKLTIIVSDTGRGIKKEQMDNLFTKFNRLEEDKNTTIEGTGLGLAITKSLVEMMGGKIVVDSTYGEGSKFTVFLSQKITNDSTIEKVERVDTFDGKKVLIVDDNKLNIKVASKILKEFNLDIDECESGFECINKIENNNKYDIIFMDIMMPKMSGTETLKKLKQIENFNIPVVALTADAFQSQGKSNKYLEVGFNDYLSKPIDKNELNKVLNKILNKVEIEEQKIEEDPDIHKVTPITDEAIAELNRLFGEPTLISQDGIEKRDKERQKEN